MQGSEQTPKAPLGNNARPLQPLHHRTIRTNIDFNSKVKYLDVHSFGGESFIYPLSLKFTESATTTKLSIINV